MLRVRFASPGRARLAAALLIVCAALLVRSGEGQFGGSSYFLKSDRDGTCATATSNTVGAMFFQRRCITTIVNLATDWQLWGQQKFLVWAQHYMVYNGQQAAIIRQDIEYICLTAKEGGVYADSNVVTFMACGDRNPDTYWFVDYLPNNRFKYRPAKAPSLCLHAAYNGSSSGTNYPMTVKPCSTSTRQIWTTPVALVPGSSGR